ncbi:MAG: GNAT family protein [Bacteroidota bacterium]
MLTIASLTLSDFHLLERWIKTEEALVQFAGPMFRFPLTIDQFESYLADHERSVFAAIWEEEGRREKIGLAELYDVSVDANKIARVLIGDPSARGKGLGAELIRRLVRHSFEMDEKEFVFLNVYDWNTSAIRCYQKVGFRKTNRPPKITCFAGKQWSAIEMGLKKSDGRWLNGKPSG